jgi:FAD/FMN-containing dehydrogenase
MGADNVLSFDAITAKGEYVTANAKENPDLFWALKGGGPSSFAVVVSIDVKTFPEVPTAGTILNINSTHTNDTFLQGLEYIPQPFQPLCKQRHVRVLRAWSWSRASSRRSICWTQHG